ncbi:MAG: orotidine-5'-phosphate decarboxylase [Lentisphaeria bacterium]|nr:orotidine-5'-phosphate decarboxylase [Lentisphaeria bacterium]
MTFAEKLNTAWRKNDSMVCVGLDPDLKKLPAVLKDEKYPIFAFNKALIDATCHAVCAYKPQAAFYAGQQAEDQLMMTMEYLRETCPEIPVILDVKRGDIGSTASMYAKEAFDCYGADAATVNPYMGTDTLKPFYDRTDKGVVILCRTSNPSGCELQNLICDGKPVFIHVAELARDQWNVNGNAALVVGATCPEELARVRAVCPDMPLLVPGVGAQGGDVEAVVKNGCTADGYGLIINSSRGIIYASAEADFAEAARKATETLRDTINQYRGC